MGKPDTEGVWQRLDDVVDHVYRFKDSERGLKISITCVDSGGHYAQEVYLACRMRKNKRVFAIKGRQREGIPYVAPPSRVDIVVDEEVVGKCWLYTLGVDSGKESIMSSIQVQEPGAKYCHFPKGDYYGYDSLYFNGLLSEKLELVQSKHSYTWRWVKLKGHNRNEALDCRNYAMAGFKIINPDMMAMEQRLRELGKKKMKKTAKPKIRRKKAIEDYYDEW